jgi:hypothetical protein
MWEPPTSSLKRPVPAAVSLHPRKTKERLELNVDVISNLSAKGLTHSQRSPGFVERANGNVYRQCRLAQGLGWSGFEHVDVVGDWNVLSGCSAATCLTAALTCIFVDLVGRHNKNVKGCKLVNI